MEAPKDKETYTGNIQGKMSEKDIELIVEKNKSPSNPVKALADATEEYKEWKAKQENKPKGLGDTVAKITKATGIDKVVKFIAGEDCGCDERKKKLNELFPYKKPNCLNENEHLTLKEFFRRNPTQVSRSDQMTLLKISNRIFNERKELSSCSSCVRGMVQRLKRLLNEY